MPDSPPFPEFTEADGAALLATARESIAARLEGRSPRWPVTRAALGVELGAFVTLRSGKVPGSPLRGCIGKISAKESLVRTVREVALSAAFEDPRFEPLDRGEFPTISMEITVLTPLRQIASPAQIEVGRHGVYMSKGWHSAIFLPQVAVEQGWDRDELLVNLCYKAGLGANAWKESDAKFQVFEGRMFEEN